MHDADPVLKLIRVLQSIFFAYPVTRESKIEDSIDGHTLLTLPTELRLRIFECYAEDLWPRLMSCSKNLGRPLSNKSKPLYRFSWCEGSEEQVERRTYLYRKFFVGHDNNYPPEPGIFLSCKQIRRELIDVIARSRPFYFFRDKGHPDEQPRREQLSQWFPEGYADRIHLLQDIERHNSPCHDLNKWTTFFPALREVRLDTGRGKLRPSFCDRVEWQLGSGRNWLEKRAQEAAEAQLAHWYKRQAWLVPESRKHSLPSKESLECRALPLDRQWRLVIETEFWLLARSSDGLNGKLKVEVVSSQRSFKSPC